MPEFRDLPAELQALIGEGLQGLDTDPAAALIRADAALQAHRDLPTALRLRAAALRQLERNDEAEKAEAAAISASRSNPLLTRAYQALREDGAAAFEAPLRTHLEFEPNDAVALLLLAEILRSRGAIDSAEPMLRRAIAAAPNYLEAHAALARLLHAQCRASEALSALRPILHRHPHDLNTLRYQATILSEVGQLDQAADLYRELLKRHPGEPALWISFGDTQRVLGKRANAERAYRLGAARAPRNGRLWWSLAAIKTRFSEDDIAAMSAAMTAADGTDDRIHLHFALGTAHEAAGRFAEAFAHFTEGNRLLRAELSYDPAETSADVARVENARNETFFGSRREGGAAAADPIFVLGMPRSGSTLIEQILASHPAIEATAELPVLPMLAATLAGEHGVSSSADYRTLLGSLTPAARTELGERYLDRARGFRKTARPHFIDKQPFNWTDLDLIQLILPNARIIDVRRNPLDCCLSNFKLLFGQGHPSSYSLEEMAAYYGDYIRLMRHFDAILPGRIHRVIYEELVSDPEHEIRRLLHYVGVPFDPACLAFHETERTVTTASSEQVRRPLNREGIDSWRRYEPWLGPLRAALGDLPETYTA